MFAYMAQSKLRHYYHAHSGYEIHYVHSGHCSFFFDNAYIELCPGDLMINNCNFVHGPHIESDRIRTNVWFDEMMIRPLIKQYLSIDAMEPFRRFRYYRWNLGTDHRDDLEAVLRTMNRHYTQSGIIHHKGFYLTFLELMLFIYEHSQEPLAKYKPSTTNHTLPVHELLNYIDHNYMKKLTLDLLAEVVHLNKHYLVKLFKEVVGQTPFEYINKRRIMAAKLLFLHDPGKSVTDACYEVGFQRLSHFSSNFKNEVGLSPDQFRKSIVGNIQQK